ncbi:ribonuclease P [Exophiala viscosa]|uniref:Ribonuclease P n=1 Tax=Exophiala viscosa TaxID=2486360 RepID=A0AAN6E3T2_9EURO|nr:ribonuclease P [Exophiala viscosa]
MPSSAPDSHLLQNVVYMGPELQHCQRQSRSFTRSFPTSMPAVFPAPGGPSPKINISSGVLPPYITPTQAPTRKSPWGTIRDVGFVQTADMALPEELYDILWRHIEASTPPVAYAKVIMKLEDVLQGGFFNQYIKQGNIMMLSEGEAGVDEVISLIEGVLRLELSKEVYERAGLQGTPVPSGGRKHVKSRFLVEINLRLPSMLHGKKGFERLLWTAKNVLNKSLNWIFLDLDQPKDSDPSKQPIAVYHPTMQPLQPTTHTLSNVPSPSTLTAVLPIPPQHAPSEETQETLFDLLEYLDMLALTSPQVQTSDTTDPFISRYEVPDVEWDNSSQTSHNVKVVKWTGLISIQWVLELLCTVIKQSRTQDLQNLTTQSQWLALSVSAHKTQVTGQTDGCTLLLQPQSGTDEQFPEDDGTDAAADTAADTAASAEPQVESESGPGAEKDTEMTDPRAGGRPQPQKPASRKGFQRFLCAEYVDSLT